MNNNRQTLFIFFLILGLGLAMYWGKHQGQLPNTSPEILPSEIMNHIRFLSDDVRSGRYPGTLESRSVVSYIIRYFRSFGIRPGGENGSFVQSFDIVDGIELGKHNEMVIGGDSLLPGEDYIPLSFSNNQKLTAPAVFAGYGFSANEKNLKWNDYEKLDVSGKWVVVMRHSPEREKRHSIYAPYASMHKKMLTARDNGAAGIIFISQLEDATLYPLQYISGYAKAGIPAIHLGNKASDKLLINSNWSREKIQQTMNRTLKSISFKIENITISSRVDLIETKIRAANVIGEIRSGNREYRDEYLVLGAHFDHLGLGGPRSGSRIPGMSAIHNGADDNSSGTAGLLELAHKIMSQKSHLKRSILLIAFDAEEKGLLGSKHFIDHPTIKLENITAMINLDMIGRLKDSTLNVGGVGTSPIFEPLLDSLILSTSMKLNKSNAGFGPSDHASFYKKDIPVLFFNTGTHEEYHTPEDKWKLINLRGETEILNYVHQVIYELCRLPEKPLYTPAGPKEQIRNYQTSNVKFGIMPAYGGSENGLKIDGISDPDGAAAKAGIKKGDLIKSINGKSINDIYEYMDRLGELEPGMNIPVQIERNGNIIKISVTL
tara:strand:- start:12280 stop:14088 length:1809 start_codon:yes stop_codon:yes gene_type:complete